LAFPFILAANSSLVTPIITLSEISKAFDNKAKWPACSMSKVPPVAARLNLLNTSNTILHD
jgi:hypothetical protein